MKKHKYSIIGKWVYESTIESDKPREEMLDEYSTILNKNQMNAVFVHGNCIEVFECPSCNVDVVQSDKFCRSCGTNLK